MSKKQLTSDQIKFIHENYSEMTINQMTIELGLRSNFKLQEYLTANKLKRGQQELTDEQKQFTRENYKQFKEPELQRKFGLKSRYLIQKFKREEGLKTNRQIVRKPKVIEGEFFNVNSRWNWAM